MDDNSEFETDDNEHVHHDQKPRKSPNETKPTSNVLITLDLSLIHRPIESIKK